MSALALNAILLLTYNTKLLNLLYTIELLIIYQPIAYPSMTALSAHVLDTTIVLQYSVVAPGLLDAKYNRFLIPTDTSAPTNLPKQ